MQKNLQAIKKLIKLINLIFLKKVLQKCRFTIYRGLEQKRLKLINQSYDRFAQYGIREVWKHKRLR